MPKTSQNEPSNTDQLTFLSLEPLARISPSPASEREWMERVATCPSDLLNLLGRYGPAGCCSKTSLGFLAPLRTKRRVRVHRQTIYSREKNGSLKTTTKLTKEVISDTSYPRFSNSGILSPTQHWTLSTSDWRSGATVCSLSEVLETGAVHQRYYLTSKACLGILRRAEKRGKELPEQLARALRAVAGLEPTSTLGGGLSRTIGAVIPTQTQEYKCCMDVGNEPCNACPKLKDAIGFRATGQDGYLPSEISPPLCSTDGGGTIPSIAFTERGRDQGRTFEAQEELAYALCNPGSGGRTHSRQIFTPMMAVRRLTPLECTRLQGFADDFFDHVLYRGKPPADGPIYKALGNSMAVPVIAWIGKRIAQVDAIHSTLDL